ncbi:hypothetical protein LB504_012303 [Fusarium proliferatum]|nr:hypothetical protein LB504_012303 [Fusarium proliferatum]
MISSAQQQDGYLNVHYIVVEPAKRWTKIRDMYKLIIYFSGLLRSMYLSSWSHFGHGEGQLKGYPGQTEIELSLFRLYAATGNTRVRPGTVFSDGTRKY